MRILSILMLVLVMTSCREEQPGVVSKPSTPKVEFPRHFDSAWVMSSGWFGYMGVAIAISGDRYFYWMYSDVGGPGSFPYTGRYSIKDDILHLGVPTSLVTGRQIDNDDLHALYSDKWKVMRRGLTTNLHAERDKPDDHARTLILDVQFDPQNPFRNQDRLKPNQAAPSDGDDPQK